MVNNNCQAHYRHFHLIIQWTQYSTALFFSIKCLNTAHNKSWIQLPFVRKNIMSHSEDCSVYFCRLQRAIVLEFMQVGNSQVNAHTKQVGNSQVNAERASTPVAAEMNQRNGVAFVWNVVHHYRKPGIHSHSQKLLNNDTEHAFRVCSNDIKKIDTDTAVKSSPQTACDISVRFVT